MSFDSEQLFSSAQAVTEDTWSTNAIAVNKTGAEGVLIEVKATGSAGTSPTVDVIAYERAADSGWATTDPKAGVLRTVSADGRYFFRVMSKLKYVKLYYDIGGTGSVSWTITAGPVTGGQREMVA